MPSPQVTCLSGGTVVLRPRAAVAVDNLSEHSIPNPTNPWRIPTRQQTTPNRVLIPQVQPARYAALPDAAPTLPLAPGSGQTV